MLRESRYNIDILKMVFCNEYILIIYPKTILIKTKKRNIRLDKNISKNRIFNLEKNLEISDIE